MKKIIASLYSLLLISSTSFALEPNDETILPSGHTWIKETTEAWRKNATADQQVKLGIRADRKARRVEIAAVGTGTAESGVLEFLLVGESGRAYESLAVTSAKPSEVAEALDFIGLPRGRAVNFRKHQFWPKGERVNISVIPLNEDGTKGKEIKLATLIREAKRTDGTSEVGSFVYVASKELGQNGKILVDDTDTIVSLFSDPFTVLDVPDQTPQGEHYGSVTAAGNQSLNREGRLIVVLSPEYPADKKRIKDFSLKVLPGAEADSLAFSLSGLNDEKNAKTLELPALLEHFQSLIKKGHDPYLHLSFDPKLSLKTASEFSRMIDTVASRGLLRIEATAGTPYYQALMPDPKWRNRKTRPAQPLELHLEPSGNDWKGKIVRPKFERSDDGWNVKVTETAFETEAALDKLLADDEGGDALFYYLPESTTYGPLLALYKKLHKRWPVQYILLNAPE